MRRFFSYYYPKLPIYLAYMLQQVEYNPGKFVAWLFKRPDLTRVMHRQQLVWTNKAKLLVAIISLFWVFYIALTVLYIFIAPISAVIVGLLAPYLVIINVYVIVLAAWVYIEQPRRKKLLSEASKRFAAHPATKIAITGSYGKTTMKELLRTVLSEGKHIAATPGNKNVPISHAAWVKRLQGDEEVLLIEYGEGAPGDIQKLAKVSHPDYAIITGLAPNHLDEYKTLDAVAKDLLSIGKTVDAKHVFVDTTSPAFATYDLQGYKQYSKSGLLGWKVSAVHIGYEGTSFTLKKGSTTLNINSGLLGEHQVAPLALVAVLAHKLGLTKQQIEAGFAKTTPFEHRMQPRHQHGAWIIDDTYNGSIEGLRAGIALLKQLPAKRKIYVTPGLVDQGEETERVHNQIGEMLGQANPDRIVLMQNSVTEYILKGLELTEYSGELQIEADPLAFYTNLEHIVAAGDLVLLQNDWTDNYL